ncbi:MAG: hypothetical protein P4L74_00660 [Candidatus Doudnabacteria bacterium]|nr:hypothetical protein [Candidatus Doudnabacteria bacterium]
MNEFRKVIKHINVEANEAKRSGKEPFQKMPVDFKGFVESARNQKELWRGWVSEQNITRLLAGNPGELYVVIEGRTKGELKDFLKYLDDVLPDMDEIPDETAKFWETLRSQAES